MIDDCLVEIGTEELPPKALKSLSESFGELMKTALQENGLAPAAVEVFATPRRLALLFRAMPTRQPARQVERRGPAVAAAFDAAGEPTRAALGFAASCGVGVEQLTRRENDKGAWLYYEGSEPGQDLAAMLPELVKQALARLPIPRRMRWGTRDDEFVRPVKWLLMMVGSETVKGSVYGVESDRYSYGHRFHSPGRIALEQAGEYEITLLSEGMVMSDFEKRREAIRTMVEHHAGLLGGIARIDEALLEEVTALVEYPVAISGDFSSRFLEVPQEALVMTMQDNQKYFAVFDSEQRLLPHFITIANIDSKCPEEIARGNERVIRPRFADAEFFYQQDRRQPLADLRDRLDTVVFQDRLGSIGDKVERLARLAAAIAEGLGADSVLVNRAAQLSKCDLMTEMVGEFPRLQGVMGRYYAQNDGEDERVSDAIEQHYWPRFAGDELPANDVGRCLALADRLDSLVGIFAIGQKPTGVKDPFALRRAALGVVRILIENDLPLDLDELCRLAADGLAGIVDAGGVIDEVIDYLFDRLDAYYHEQAVRPDIVDAVTVTRPTLLRDCNRRVRALERFQSNEAAPALAAANKRIGNILKKQSLEVLPAIDTGLLVEPAEIELAEQIDALNGQVSGLFADGRYFEGLELLARLRPSVDRFFDDVMVMVEDEATRNNRLALLARLQASFRQVADFSRIQ